MIAGSSRAPGSGGSKAVLKTCNTTFSGTGNGCSGDTPIDLMDSFQLIQGKVRVPQCFLFRLVVAACSGQRQGSLADGLLCICNSLRKPARI